ncbi:HNH/endonuclease VII fold putative polymorphic toxin, partial [Yersinia wautersii]|uniref:HNH/endonuclease VII fold putative polymorphic toxin n=1 Tax=Yersinia wautersii TaxID=1341643 RepID=UPI002351E1B5
NSPDHTGNDQSTGQGATNTGNTDGKPDAGGSSTVTPIPEGANKDDLVYQSEDSRPENMSPEGAGRSGAFNEAKRQSGIPVSKNPDRVLPNVDKRGNAQPGKIYEFDVPKPGGGIQTIQIRDDVNGHFFGEQDVQNRGSHFNDQKGNHYDY